jgi:hypothetical protein
VGGIGVPKLALGGATQPVTPITPPPVHPPNNTTRLAVSTPRVGGGQPMLRFQDARDELAAVYHHTFVLLGDCGAGKTAFRSVLGKDLGFLERRRTPETVPTMGFEIQRFERVGSTTKCDMTMLELSGSRAFTPLSWMIPFSRSTCVIFFKLHGADGRRCDLQYFQPYIDMIRSACPTSECSVILMATHRDVMPDTSDASVVDTLLAVSAEISNYWAAVEPIPENRPVIRARFAISSKDRTVVASTTPGSRPASSSVPSGSLTARLFSSALASSGDASTACRKMSELLEWFVGHSIARCKDDAVFARGLLPKRILTVLERVKAKRQHGRFALKGTEYKELAREVDQRYSTSKDELFQHTQLLHSWLRVYHHYRHTSLKRHVFIDVEWVFRLLAVWCCTGACVQTGAFNPTLVGGSSDATDRFVRMYPTFPFSVGEVRRCDVLQILHAGLITMTVASALFRDVIKEKRYAASEVSVAVDLLSQFDLMFPASKLMQWVDAQWVSQHELLAPDLTKATGDATPEPVFITPGFFSKPAPESVTVFMPDMLSAAGPTVCFTLTAVPVLFFSRLLTRLSRLGRGMYFGPSHFWGDCAWLIASDSSRVLLRLVSRSLFVTFHDHDPVKSAELQAQRAATQGSGLAGTRRRAGRYRAVDR